MNKSSTFGAILIFEGLLLLWQGVGIAQYFSWCTRFSLGFSGAMLQSIGYIVSCWGFWLGLLFIMYGIIYLILAKLSKNIETKIPEIAYIVIGGIGIVLSLL